MNTIFPRLRVDDVQPEDDPLPPELEESSDEESSCGSFSSLNDKYGTKEDEDVAMFLSLVNRMSIQSLLFILQNHAREVHKIPEQQLQQVLARGSAFHHPTTTSSNVRVVTKKFRFAEIMGGTRIREQVLEIPHVSEFTSAELEELWWTKDEQLRMRCNARRAVRFFSKHRPAYHESVEYLLDSYQEDSDDILVEHHVKKLAADSFPRGLECHFVSCLGDHRHAGVRAVLEEQAEVILDGIDCQDSVAEERIRNRYRQVSLPCRTLAKQLARCDHIEALKCSLSSWTETPSPTTPTSTSTTSCASNSARLRTEAPRPVCRWKS